MKVTSTRGGRGAVHGSSGAAGADEGARKRKKGSSPTANAGAADGKKRFRAAADADHAGTASFPVKKRAAGPATKLFAAGKKQKRGVKAEKTRVEEKEEEPCDSGEDETITGLEQLVQASLEVERMERGQAESGGEAGEPQENRRGGENAAMAAAADSSVRGANSFLDHAQLHLYANLQMQQHLAQLVAQQQQQAGTAAGFPGTSGATDSAAYLQYPSFHLSGATSKSSDDASEAVTNNNTSGIAVDDNDHSDTPSPKEHVPRAESPTSSGCNFMLQQHMQMSQAGAMNPLVMQMMLLQQQQRQQQQQVTSVQRLLLEQQMAAVAAQAQAGKADTGSEGSGLSAFDAAVPFGTQAAGAHHWCSQMQGLFGMMMEGGMGATTPGGGAGLTSAMMQAMQQAQPAAVAPAGGGAEGAVKNNAV